MKNINAIAMIVSAIILMAPLTVCNANNNIHEIANARSTFSNALDLEGQLAALRYLHRINIDVLAGLAFAYQFDANTYADYMKTFEKDTPEYINANYITQRFRYLHSLCDIIFYHRTKGE